MREIRFRCWDGKAMHEVFDLSQNPKYWWKEHQDDYPLMQFTGLKDKNGVDIFEGDVIRRLGGNGEWIGVVVWDDRNLRYGLGRSKSTLVPTSLAAGLAVRWQEIIGNIYENPEILEDQS